MLSQPDIWRSPPAQRFAAIIVLLRHIIGVLGYRRVNPLLGTAIYARLGYFARHVARILANPAPPRRARHRPTARSRQDQTAHPSPETVKLPTSFGWMLTLYPGHLIPGARSQLTHWINEPAMIALITADPRLGRALRPLCHALRITPPPHLGLPRRTPHPPREQQARPPKPPKPSPYGSTRPPLWGLHTPPARPIKNQA